MRIITDNRQEYIEQRSILVPESNCWIWKGYLDSQGYGSLRYNEKNHRAHRHSYEAFIGEIPKGLLVCHHCDTPSCVNPEHLFLGTAKDNTQDCINKGRYRHYTDIGEKNIMAKLTEKEVLEIREKYVPWQYTLVMLAKEYNVNLSHINRIVNNKSWKHLDETH